MVPYGRGNITMIKIKISYQNSQELEQVLQLLQPIIKTSKVLKEHGSRFERAYITINVKKC